MIYTERHDRAIRLTRGNAKAAVGKHDNAIADYGEAIRLELERDRDYGPSRRGGSRAWDSKDFAFKWPK